MVGFEKKTVKDIELKGKRVLLRADYSVPVINGVITDDYRMRMSLPTVEYILGQKGSSLVIISHMGRPQSRDDKDLSLAPAAKHLSKLLNMPVKFVPDCIGPEVKEASEKLGNGEILLLENLRYYKQESDDDTNFAKEIVKCTGAEVFVQDGFAVVHRKHASTDAITKLLPSVAGLLLEAEVTAIELVIKDPARPLVSVVGGAKISDKIEVLNKLIEISDCVAVVGAMANDFLLAEGHRVGKSKVERELLDKTNEILDRVRKEEKNRNFNFLVPVDAVVSTKVDGTGSTRIVDLASHDIADIEAYPKQPSPASYTVKADELILDIGPASSAQIAGVIKMAATVIWNGTCGVTETKGIAAARAPFAHGTRTIVEAMIGSTNKHKNRPFSLVGGGDTVSYVEQEGLTEDFGFVSTGGGASLELITGHKLPGVEALQSKN